MYADWCARLINVDAPGSTSANLPTLGHTRCRPADLPARKGHSVRAGGETVPLYEYRLGTVSRQLF